MTDIKKYLDALYKAAQDASEYWSVEHAYGVGGLGYKNCALMYEKSSPFWRGECDCAAKTELEAYNSLVAILSRGDLRKSLEEAVDIGQREIKRREDCKYYDSSGDDPDMVGY